VVYPYDRLQPWSHLGTLFAGQFVMGLLGGLIGGAFLIAGRPAILVLIIGVYAIGHLSLYAFSQLRISHLSAIKGFVKTLEAKDMYTRGHTERVAYFAEMIGEEYGFNGTQIEVIKWAALIHDLGKLAVPTELIRKRGRLDDEEYAQMKQHAHLVEEILAEVDFLQPMVEIASGHHSHYDGNGYGGRGHNEGETPSLETCIVAVADAFDAMTSARSYRMALAAVCPRRAAEELGSPVPSRRGRRLRARPRQVGQALGRPHVNDEEMARRLAEEPELTSVANWHPRVLAGRLLAVPGGRRASVSTQLSCGGRPAVRPGRRRRLVDRLDVRSGHFELGQPLHHGSRRGRGDPLRLLQHRRGGAVDLDRRLRVGLAAVWAIPALARAKRHTTILLPVMVRRFGGYVVYAIVYSAMRVGLFAELDGGWEDLFPFAVAVAAWLAVEVVIRAMFVCRSPGAVAQLPGPGPPPRHQRLHGPGPHRCSIRRAVSPNRLVGASHRPAALFVCSLGVQTLPGDQDHLQTDHPGPGPDPRGLRSRYRRPCRPDHRDSATSIAKEMGLGPGQVDAGRVRRADA
jgi:putative nucleotidyltransferase with HDIG domain